MEDHAITIIYGFIPIIVSFLIKKIIVHRKLENRYRKALTEDIQKNVSPTISPDELLKNYIFITNWLNVTRHQYLVRIIWAILAISLSMGWVITSAFIGGLWFYFSGIIFICFLVWFCYSDFLLSKCLQECEMTFMRQLSVLVDTSKKKN